MTKEILLFDDGIGVKKQKETRSPNQDVVSGEAEESGQKKKRKTVITDVVLLQTPKGSFKYLTSPIDNQGQPLISFITKHKSEIINYEWRRQAGKTIGSGRRSKGVDTVIGHRQKHKGMSWSALGSKVLAILKVTECNGQWRSTWFTQMAA